MGAGAGQHLLCHQDRESHVHATSAMEDVQLGIFTSTVVFRKPSPSFLKQFVFLSGSQEFQKTLGGKQPVYDTTIRTGRALKEKALLPDDTQKLDNLLGEVRDKWDTVCGKSVER